MTLGRGTAKEHETAAEPLSGEDAERLVAYIENPAAGAPEGHNDFLHQSDQVYTETELRSGATR